MRSAAKAKEKIDPRVDELGELLLWEQDNKDKINRLKALKSEFSGEIRESKWAPDAEVPIIGAQFQLVVEAAKNESKCTNAKRVHELFVERLPNGDHVFYEGITVPIKLLEDYLTPEEREQVMQKERTGARIISVKRLTRRPQPAA